MLTRSAVRVVVMLAVASLFWGCQTNNPQTGQRLERRGQEIMVAGQLFHVGAPVVLWTDPGGYDAYRTERRFAPMERSGFAATIEDYKGDKNRVTSPNRYNVRANVLTAEEIEMVRGGGWPLELVQDRVDQFVMHFDVAGTARQCFNILHDLRGLSVHFLLDVDGTIYQTLDVKERAWHATKANSRSIGIEIANIGAYSPDDRRVLDQWYRKDERGRTRMVLPAWMKQEWIRTPNFIAYPIRNEAVVGRVQGRNYRMYDLTPEQYDSLIKLTAALCTVLPKINPDYPRDENGRLITRALTSEQFEEFQGILGHYHVQTNKQDPGPAFQWDLVINEARKLMGLSPLPPGDIINDPSLKPAAEIAAGE